MKRFLISGGLLAACLALLLSGALQLGGQASAGTQRATTQKAAAENWYRGQIHIHANWADPVTAMKWYRYHGYDFAAITDLNHYKPVNGLKALFDDPGRFLVIPGVETSVEPGNKIIDVMGFGGDPSKAQMPKQLEIPAAPAAGILNYYAKSMRKAGVIPYAAHPNLNWSITAEDLLKTDPKLIRHFEIRNGEPGMNDLGGGGRLSTEEIWDRVLSTGRVLYAVADDDSHHFYDFGPQLTFMPNGQGVMRYPANPGRCSIFVRASKLATKPIVAAFSRGDFYSVCHFTSVPIKFSSYAVDKSGIRLKLPSTVIADLGWSKPGENEIRYRTYFIGKDGKVLKVDQSFSPSYSFKGDELYVRVRVEDSDGGVAWTQPVFVNRL